jgi:hypothetical protein
MKPPVLSVVSSSAPHDSVPAAKYCELAIAHVRANGGKGVVVEERGTPAPWRAWLAYFAHLDDQTWPRGKKVQTFRSMRNGATVPTEWPYQFDLSAPPAPMFEPDAPVSPARRRALADRLRALVASWDTPRAGTAWRAPDARHVLDARTAPTPELKAQAVAYHEQRLAELAKAYAAADAATDEAQHRPSKRGESNQ